jgi:glutamate synthase (NADPH/NADH) small chain
MWLTLPVKFHGRDGKLTKIECIKMKLSSPDTSGRAKPIPIEGSNFCIDADTAIIAIGQSPNPLLTKSTPELKTSDRGTIIVDERMRSSIPHVYAGGDITTGAATVISAMGQAKIAAASIIEDLKA